MKIVSILFITVFIMVASAVLCTDIDKDTIAIVNGKEISRAVFDRQIVETKRRIERRGQSIDDDGMLRIRVQVLETLINNELLYQESVSKGYKANDLKTMMQFERIKGQFGTEEQFLYAIKQRGYTVDSLHEEIRRLIAIEDYIDVEIAKKIIIPEEDMLDYYESNPENFKQLEQVRASHILISVDDMTDETKKRQALKKIREIQKMLRKGEDFETLAKEHSQCPSSTRGGDLGYFSRGKMVKPFEDAVFALETDEVSDIVETRFGYHLIKLIDRKPERTITFDEVKDSIEQYLGEGKIFEQVNVLIEKLRGEAKIERFLEETGE